MLTFVLIFLAVVAAYYFLGTPLLSTIHQFTEQFTRSFPLWVFFLPGDARGKDDRGEGTPPAAGRSRRV